MTDEPKLEPGLAVMVGGLPDDPVRTLLREADNERLVLAAGDGEALPQLQAGTILQLHLYLPTGQWSGQSRFLGERVMGERQWLVTRPASWQRGQRRTYFRLPIALPFLWSRVDRGGTWQSAVTRDLSAGGLSFVESADRGLQVGERVVIRLALGNEALELQGEVVRLSALGAAETAPGRGLLVGVHFVELSPRTEERLVRYIFQVETARRRLNRAAQGFGGMTHDAAGPVR